MIILLYHHSKDDSETLLNPFFFWSLKSMNLHMWIIQHWWSFIVQLREINYYAVIILQRKNRCLNMTQAHCLRMTCHMITQGTVDATRPLNVFVIFIVYALIRKALRFSAIWIAGICDELRKKTHRNYAVDRKMSPILPKYDYTTRFPWWYYYECGKII